MTEKSSSSLVLFFIPFLVLSLTGCDKIQDILRPPAQPKLDSGTPAGPAQVQGTPLVTVNDEVITLESFEDQLKSLKELSPTEQVDTLDAKKEYLKSLIAQELFYQEARARGLDKKRETKEAIKGVLATQLLLDETKGITVDPQEIETFYNQNKKEFATPEEVRAQELVVASEITAKEILITLLQGADFAAAAKQHSISASASKGGDLGFIKKGEKFDKFNEIISTLEPGQISQIFKGADGYYMIKVVEKKGGQVPPLTEFYDKIKDYLVQQKKAQRIQELADKLRKEAKIDESKVDTLLSGK